MYVELSFQFLSFCELLHPRFPDAPYEYVVSSVQTTRSWLHHVYQNSLYWYDLIDVLAQYPGDPTGSLCESMSRRFRLADRPARGCLGIMGESADSDIVKTNGRSLLVL